MQTSNPNRQGRLSRLLQAYRRVRDEQQTLSMQGCTGMTDAVSQTDLERHLSLRLRETLVELSRYKAAYEHLSSVLQRCNSALEESHEGIMRLFEPTRDSASPAAAHPSIEIEDLHCADTAPDTLRSAQLPPFSSDDTEPGVTLCPSTERALSRSALQADATKL